MEITLNKLMVGMVILIAYFFYLAQLHTVSPLSATVNKDKNSFIRPENKLYYLLHNISSADKITLKGKCQSNYYTEYTVPTELKTFLKKNLTNILNTVHDISQSMFSVNNITNVYEQIDSSGNCRYIIKTTITDIKEYYTVGVIVDIIYYKQQMYINYIHIDTSSNSTLINNYDRVASNDTLAILDNKDTFSDNIRIILDEHYTTNYDLINVYPEEDTNTDGVLSLDSLANSFFPANMSNESIKQYEDNGLDGLVKGFLPQEITSVVDPSFCNKESLDWGISGTNVSTNSKCIASTNQTIAKYNVPWQGPGLFFDRSGVMF
jgi:hypothetical protein